jgi:hypothetical protein
MRAVSIKLCVLLSFVLTACGNSGEIKPPKRGSAIGGTNTGAPQPLPLPGRTPGATTGTTTPATGTFFDLVAPAVAAGTTVIPLRAALVSSTGSIFLVTSVHTGTTSAPTPITAGTYSLIFHNENDGATAFRQTVTVSPGVQNRFLIGSVLVDPNSAVQASRTATVSIPYQIQSTEGTLKTVIPNLNTVIDLPPRAFDWVGIGSTGFLPAFSVNAGTTLLTQTWGSIQVLKDPTDTISISSSNGTSIFPETVDGVEYLLPATPQSQGCMVYLGIVNLLTTRTITLCTDAISHVVFNER